MNILADGVNQKNPVLAALGSFFIPGLGQVYNGEGFLKGLLFLIGTMIGYCLLVIPGLIIWIYGVYNAYSVAKKINAGIMPAKSESTMTLVIYAILGFAIIFVFIVVFTIILAAIIAAFVFAIGGSSTTYY